jgi:hypothetical protein
MSVQCVFKANIHNLSGQLLAPSKEDARFLKSCLVHSTKQMLGRKGAHNAQAARLLRRLQRKLTQGCVGGGRLMTS